jgi:hypothetical protein
MLMTSWKIGKKSSVRWPQRLGIPCIVYDGESLFSDNSYRDPNMVVDRFLIPESESITPRDYKSQTMRRLREGFQLAKENLLEARRQQKAQYDKRAKKEKFEVGDRVLLDVRVTKLGTSKKLNPRYHGPFRVSKVFPNHTVEIRAYNGNGTQFTHVNCLKALTECMIWRDEKCVDFDYLRESKLTKARQRDVDSDDEKSSDQEDEEDEFNDSDPEEDDISANLDAVMNNDQDVDLINFDPVLTRIRQCLLMASRYMTRTSQNK